MEVLLQFFWKYKLLTTTVLSLGSWLCILATGIVVGPRYAFGLTVAKYTLVFVVGTIAGMLYAKKKLGKK